MEKLSTLLYITLGWLAIVAIKPLFMLMPLYGFIFLIAGGVFYTLGTYFYLHDKIKYSHGIWHIFVLSGSVCSYF